MSGDIVADFDLMGLKGYKFYEDRGVIQWKEYFYEIIFFVNNSCFEKIRRFEENCD